MKTIMCILVIIGCVSCKQPKAEAYKTDVEFLKNYINLPCEPTQVQYEFVEKNLSRGSQDYSKLIYIVGIMKFSDEDFENIMENLKKEKKYDTYLDKGDAYYKNWYTPNIEKMFLEGKSVTIYNGDFLKKDNDSQDGAIDYIIVSNNEILISIGYCW
jgi:hypothetical protein